MITFQTAAKLNLFLAVYPVNSSGMHPLASVMQSISLLDTMCISEIQNKTLAIHCNHPALQHPEQNILTRIYNDFASELPCGFSITLTKQIPIGGGLGGSSSNAAGFLRFLNDCYLHWNDKKLQLKAHGYGSDIPFMLHGGCKWVKGTGELLSDTDIITPSHYVLITPPVDCNSGKVYQRFDTLPAPQHPKTFELGYNDLFAASRLEYPELEETITALHDQDITAYFSGSGATFYCPHNDASTAQQQADQLQSLLPTHHIKTVQKLNTSLLSYLDQ